MVQDRSNEYANAKVASSNPHNTPEPVMKSTTSRQKGRSAHVSGRPSRYGVHLGSARYPLMKSHKRFHEGFFGGTHSSRYSIHHPESNKNSLSNNNNEVTKQRNVPMVDEVVRPDSIKVSE
jgi:hypothetical protein